MLNTLDSCAAQKAPSRCANSSLLRLAHRMHPYPILTTPHYESRCAARLPIFGKAQLTACPTAIIGMEARACR